MRSDRRKSAKPSRSAPTPLPALIPKIDAVGLTTRKSRGEAAEAAFLAKAATFGFGISKTWGDSERYDFILDSGGQRWRVQVKSTQRFAESRYRVKPGGSTSNYTRDEIDFIVAYIVPEDLWYVVPVDACVDHTSLRFYPYGGKKARLEKYREAWCQLACPRQGRTPILIARRCQAAAPQAQQCPFRS